HRYYNFLKDLSFNINGKTIEVHPLINPDFNMVDYVLQEKGNNSLADINKLNHDFYEEASYVKGSLYSKEYIVSHTDFAIPDYGDSPLAFVKSLGVSEDDWKQVGKVTVIRASVMTPYMNKAENFDYFAPKIKLAMKQDLENIYSRVLTKGTAK
ncbi:tyrosine decarboxylase, partial [Lentilactobacillus otakiensis]